MGYIVRVPLRGTTTWCRVAGRHNAQAACYTHLQRHRAYSSTASVSSACTTRLVRLYQLGALSLLFLTFSLVTQHPISESRSVQTCSNGFGNGDGELAAKIYEKPWQKPKAASPRSICRRSVESRIYYINAPEPHGIHTARTAYFTHEVRTQVHTHTHTAQPNKAPAGWATHSISPNLTQGAAGVGASSSLTTCSG